MSLFYRLLGLTALVDEFLGCIRVYYIVRGNWILFAIILIYFFAGASALGLPWPVLPLEIPLAYPGLQAALALLGLTLLVLCWIRRAIIFRPMSVVPRPDAMSPAPAVVTPKQIDLRISGRFDRGTGHSLSLRDFPVRWNIHDTGAISIETDVAVVGVSLTDNSGRWSVIVPRETLSDGGEEGMLYFGVSARPAVRLKLPGRRTTAILSFKSASQLSMVRHMFELVLTESAEKEATFRTELQANLNATPEFHYPVASRRLETGGEEIPWKNLIDFSGT
jgi:hypothetical protein